MKEFKKFCWMAFAFCFIVLFASVNVSFAGPFGLFPNFHPLRTTARVASAPFRAVRNGGFGGCGGSLAEARYERRTGRFSGGSCANGACQAPVQAGPAVQKK